MNSGMQIAYHICYIGLAFGHCADVDVHLIRTPNGMIRHMFHKCMVDNHDAETYAP